MLLTSLTEVCWLKQDESKLHLPHEGIFKTRLCTKTTIASNKILNYSKTRPECFLRNKAFKIIKF